MRPPTNSSSRVERRKRARGYTPALTARHLSQLLPGFLAEIGKVYQDRPDLIVSSWPSIIGPKLAPMAHAVSFYEGVLTVKVRNSTLYSLLAQHDKPRLLKSLREKFPNTMIKTILFRLG